MAPISVLLRELIIANTHASSMRSRVMVFKSIHRKRVGGRKRCENAKVCLEKGEKKVVFSNEYGYVWTGPYFHHQLIFFLNSKIKLRKSTTATTSGPEGSNGIRTHDVDLCDASAMLYQLSYEATLLEAGQFVGLICFFKGLTE